MTEETKPKKAAPEVTKVVMEDGRTVDFVGKRRMLKESTLDADAGEVSTRFDFVNGSTRTFTANLSDPLALSFIAHGIEQKVGDSTAGVENVDDMVLAVEATMDRLAKGEWGIQRAASDGFSGANVVVKALVEASKGSLSVAQVKAYLEKKLATTEGLTRQALYKSFRAPGTKTAAIIARLEAEKAKKESAINADDALSEMMEE